MQLVEERHERNADAAACHVGTAGAAAGDNEARHTRRLDDISSVGSARRPRCWRTICMTSSLCLVAVLLAAGWCIRQPPPQEYSDERAIQFARLAGAAYCSRNSLTTWSCGPKCVDKVESVHVCDGATTKAFAAMWEGRCLLSFMGTHDYSAFITDLKFYHAHVSWDGCANCSVHGGFLAEWQSLEKCLSGSLQRLGCASAAVPQVRVTGHSLGAAVASLAMSSLSTRGWHIEEAYTFGMPRTGDENFAREFEKRFSQGFYRITHHMDPVVQLPPSSWVSDWHYLHVEPEVFYNGTVQDGHVFCTSDGDQNCSGMYPYIFYDMMHVDDHLKYVGVNTSSTDCSELDREAIAARDREARAARPASIVVI